MGIYLLVFLIPVFTLIGFIDTVTWIVKKLSPSTASKLVQPVIQYQKSAEPAPVKISVPVVTSTPQSVAVSNWYSENSINLLLYLGAFLIVATASLFVGMQWSVIDGMTKGIFLTITALGFLVVGLAIFGIEKVKSASATFAAIGTLLIPFVGFAWQTFVLRDMGIPMGTTWAVTSVVELVVALGVGWYFKHPMYSYIANFSLMSFVVSMVNVGALAERYYAIASEISACIMIGVAFLIRKLPDPFHRQYFLPLKYASHLVMPVSILYGIVIGQKSPIGFTFFQSGIGISFLIACLYSYFVYVTALGSTEFLLASYVTLPIGIYVLLGTAHVSIDIPILTLQSISILYCMSAYAWQKLRLTDEIKISAIMGVTLSALVSVALRNIPATPAVSIGNLVLPILLPFLVEGVYQTNYWIIVSGFMSFYGVSSITKIIIPLKEVIPYVNTCLYGLTATVWHLIGYYAYRNQKSKNIIAQILVGVGILLSLSSATLTAYSMIPALVAVVLTTHGVWAYRTQRYVYLQTAALWWVVYESIKVYDIPQNLHPYLFFTIGFIPYLLSLLHPKILEQSLRRTGYISIILGSLVPAYTIFGSRMYYYPASGFQISPLFEIATIIIGLLATVFFMFEAYLRPGSWRKYLAAGMGVLTLCYIFNFRHITEYYWFSELWGCYLVTMGFFRRREGFTKESDLADIGGLFLLSLRIIPGAFGVDGVTEAVLLGINGVVLLTYGISNTRRIFTVTGTVVFILAVLSQTYRYLLGLPKWVFTGIFGIVFLGVALTLLITRPQKTKTV